MATRRTNLALLLLLLVAVVSGAGMYAVGSGWNRWPTLAHGTAAIAVVALTPWKSAISRRGLARRGAAAGAPSLALAVAVGAALVTGFAHRAGARDLGPLLVQQVHVGAALVAVPLAAWHVVSRPVRVRRADLGRRAVLRGGLVVGASAVATVALPHASGRFTRSLERGSYDPAAMPVTQWLNDEVPVVDGDGWRLAVAGRLWSLAELEGLVDERGREMLATLDCTGGWYAHQRWSGVGVDTLLAASGAAVGRSLEVRSVTGYARRLPGGDAGRLLVTTAVGGDPLSPGHGAPARLVAPGRRGFWWVKWLASVEPSDTPWWWQPPFPVT
ncbi:MAG: molybdopterin-dependent oxidoreductase [Acidimicrobiia bacterium]